MFAEGKPANYVYIVSCGEFKILKKVNKEKLTDNTEAIFQDPLRFKKLSSEFDIRNLKQAYECHILESVCSN